MKKRLLSILMAICLTISTAPTVFAVEIKSGRPIPTEFPTVYEEELATPLYDRGYVEYQGSGTKNDPIVLDIDSADDFQTLIDNCRTYTGKYYDVRLMIDLDLSQFEAPEQWDGYLNYFMGTFTGVDKENGEKVTISGIPEDCYLFYQIHNTTIGNFELDLEGKAGSLMYYTFRINKSDGSVEWGTDKLHDINVVSNKDGKTATVHLIDNGQANYAPFMFAAGPYFTMQNCKNYANISGNTYAAVFSGYYPLPAQGYPSDTYFNFSGCENHGNVNLRYAGLVFGNPTTLCEDRHISFGENNDGVKNYGEIRGTETAHFFSSDAGNNSYFTEVKYFSNMEDLLDPKDKEGNYIPDNNFMRLTCDEVGCPNKDSKGSLCFGHELNGFSVSVNPNNGSFVVDPADNEEEGTTYWVTAYHYVNLFDENGNWQGTNRVSFSEQVVAQDYETSDLVDKPLRDGVSIPEEWQPIVENGYLYYGTIGSKMGYWLNNSFELKGSEADKPYHQYIVNPSTHGEVDWVVYASAYDGAGRLIDTVPLTGVSK